MGPVLCRRHGVRFFRKASNGICARIRTRGRFAPGELVKVSLDRPKGSKARSVEAHLKDGELTEVACPLSRPKR